MSEWIFAELEHFLSRGQEKVIWILTYITCGGLLVGGFALYRMAVLAGLKGPAAFFVGAIGAAIGVYLTTPQHGIVRLRRIWLMLTFLIQRAIRAPIIDAQALYATRIDHEPPMRVRAHGGSVILAQRSGARRPIQRAEPTPEIVAQHSAGGNHASREL